MESDTVSFSKEDTLALKAMGRPLRSKEPAVAKLPLGDVEDPEKFQGYDIVATTAHITGALDEGIPKDLEVGQTVQLALDGRVSGVKFKEKDGVVERMWIVTIETGEFGGHV